MIVKSTLLLVPLLILSTASVRCEGDLLSYWSFNNCDKGSETQLGNLKNEPALYGEAYDAEKKHLASNSNYNTIFHGENIYLDLSSLNGENSKSITRGWGSFTDTRVAKLKEDDSEGGSFMTGSANNSNHITFVLSSEGYRDLALSYAHRAMDAAVIQWSYSLDGKDFMEIQEVDRTSAFTKEVINLSGEGGLGLKQLDDQKTFYLRATFVFPSSPSGSVAIDNVQLTGSR